MVTLKANCEAERTSHKEQGPDVEEQGTWQKIDDDNVPETTMTTNGLRILCYVDNWKEEWDYKEGNIGGERTHHNWNDLVSEQDLCSSERRTPVTHIMSRCPAHGRCAGHRFIDCEVSQDASKYTKSKTGCKCVKKKLPLVRFGSDTDTPVPSDH